MAFFRWDHDIANIFLDGHQGAGFQVVISSVSDKVFDCGAGFREELDLIKDN